MRFYFKPKVTATCVLLALGMIRLAFWQWDRHEEKQSFIAAMNARLELDPAPLAELLKETDSESSAVQSSKIETILHRRVTVQGEYDFDKEVLLRNRRLDGAAGVYVLTPLKIGGRDQWVLVNRGFIPLSRSAPNARRQFRTEQLTSFIGLLKEGSVAAALAPRDPPTGTNLPWVDAWLRVDLEKISAQLPYPILPFYVEVMSTADPASAAKEIVKSSAGREELLFLGLNERDAGNRPDYDPALNYPIPAFDTVIPAGRHLGYVYEWSIMAVMTLLIGLVLQLRPPRVSIPE
jgi:surfeit locus 1 family protein